MTGPSPVDRGKPAPSSTSSPTARIPLAVAVSAANTNDAQALRPLVRAIPAVRSWRGPRRRKPARLHADTAYDIAELRHWVADRGIGVRIARKGIEPSDRLGRHRWVVERTFSWLTGYHRLNLRYDRKAEHVLGPRRRTHLLQETDQGPTREMRHGLRSYRILSRPGPDRRFVCQSRWGPLSDRPTRM